MIQLREHQLRIVDKMNRHQKGQVIVPTGGGKTICMISDAISQFSKTVSYTHLTLPTIYSV